jgi:hypothetical protein
VLRGARRLARRARIDEPRAGRRAATRRPHEPLPPVAHAGLAHLDPPKCPDSYPWVRNKTYAPAFTSWGDGVEIQEDQSELRDRREHLGPVPTGHALPERHENGTLTGFPNSSATNWLWGGDHWYKVVLHCTSDACRSTDKVGPPKGCSSAGRPSAQLSRGRR